MNVFGVGLPEMAVIGAVAVMLTDFHGITAGPMGSL